MTRIECTDKQTVTIDRRTSERERDERYLDMFTICNVKSLLVCDPLFTKYHYNDNPPKKRKNPK